MTEPEIQAIYWAPLHPETYSVSKLSISLVLPPPQSLSPRRSLLSSSGLLLIEQRSQQTLYHRDNRVCVICCSGPAVVSSPPCSICHSFGVEDKHTDENDSDHRIISVSILLFLTLFLLFFSVLLLLPSFWGVTKVANMHFHSVVYAHICCILNICLRSTWTKFQTPATSPQLNFTLFKHVLSAASAMSPICAEPH